MHMHVYVQVLFKKWKGHLIKTDQDQQRLEPLCVTCRERGTKCRYVQGRPHQDPSIWRPTDECLRWRWSFRAWKEGNFMKMTMMWCNCWSPGTRRGECQKKTPHGQFWKWKNMTTKITRNKNIAIAVWHGSGMFWHIFCHFFRHIFLAVFYFFLISSRIYSILFQIFSPAYIPTFAKHPGSRTFSRFRFWTQWCFFWRTLRHRNLARRTTITFSNNAWARTFLKWRWGMSWCWHCFVCWFLSRIATGEFSCLFTSKLRTTFSFWW